jgi:cathepsin L
MIAFVRFITLTLLLASASSSCINADGTGACDNPSGVASTMTMLPEELDLLQVITNAAETMYRDAWKDWRSMNPDKYCGDEDGYQTFQQSMRVVEKHNADSSNTYSLALNKFACVPEVQFMKNLGYIRSSRTQPKNYMRANMSQGAPIPSTLNYVDLGVVTPVKNQGECGSSWAFSTTGYLESQIAIHTGRKESLSAQQIIDCSQPGGNLDIGSMMDYAFQYSMAHELAKEQDYPYRCDTDHHSCLGTTQNMPTSISHQYFHIHEGKELELQTAVATTGPVSVALDATPKSLRLYSSGIYHDNTCGSNGVNHAVLAVGYGTIDDGTDYWLVKNSWGPSWGEVGYGRLLRGANECGVATDYIQRPATD